MTEAEVTALAVKTVGENTMGIFSTISFIASIASLILAVGAIWLSIVFSECLMKPLKLRLKLQKVLMQVLSDLKTYSRSFTQIRFL